MYRPFMPHDLMNTQRRKQVKRELTYTLADLIANPKLNTSQSANCEKNGHHNIRTILKRARKVYDGGGRIEFCPSVIDVGVEPAIFNSYMAFKRWLKTQYKLYKQSGNKTPVGAYMGIPYIGKGMGGFAVSTYSADLRIV